MVTPISALEHRPSDFVREVSPDAINFYVEDLSGIYLPVDFKKEHEGRYSIDYWKPEDRLHGKFGRFALRHAQEEEGQVELDDILVMGTTIGLSELDRYGDLTSLRHYNVREVVRDVLEKRDLLGKPIKIDEADYGSTTIVLGVGGEVDALKIGGSSIDFGRARAEGRQQTCDVAGRILGNTIKVINQDPEPRDRERIVE